MISLAMVFGFSIPFTAIILVRNPDPLQFAVLCMVGIFPPFVLMGIALMRFGELKPATPPVVCHKCGSVMPASDAIFCIRCGARLSGGTAQEAPSGEQAPKPESRKRVRHYYVQGKVCMVCGLELESEDVLAWCPHCGNVAHKDHLLQWVRAKKHCPMCSHLLDERSIANRTPSV